MSHKDQTKHFTHCMIFLDNWKNEQFVEQNETLYVEELLPQLSLQQRGVV